MAAIYPPQEDSEFLASFVRKLARGKTLDIGTGSGVQAFAAAESGAVSEVVAVDVNPEAVRRLKMEVDRRISEGSIKKGRIAVLESDMFARVEGEAFDTIICNPPYLPNDARAEDIALDGGPGGFEWSERFLTSAKRHIAPNGKLLFLFSSLTNRERVDAMLQELGYHHEQLGEVVAGLFERLYVYRIWNAAGKGDREKSDEGRNDKRKGDNGASP